MTPCKHGQWQVVMEYGQPAILQCGECWEEWECSPRDILDTIYPVEQQELLAATREAAERNWI